MSISPASGAKGHQRSVCLKSYNVQKWEIRIHFRAQRCQKYAWHKKKKVFWHWISYKKSVSAYVHLTHEWNLGAPKFAMFKQIHFIAELQLNFAKTNDYIRKYFK